MIHNDIGLRAAQVEKITHNLSYLYQRATKAVSYCTPAYYADLLCARGRAWLMKAVRRKDSETKFDFSNKSNPAMTAHFRYDFFADSIGCSPCTHFQPASEIRCSTSDSQPLRPSVVVIRTRHRPAQSLQNHLSHTFLDQSPFHRPPGTRPSRITMSMKFSFFSHFTHNLHVLFPRSQKPPSTQFFPFCIMEPYTIQHILHVTKAP